MLQIQRVKQYKGVFQKVYSLFVYMCNHCLFTMSLYRLQITCLFPELEEEWWADDASDFDLDSDSEGEGDRLCNTAMLTGPLGVGKTASVYALAQELGFKVINQLLYLERSNFLSNETCSSRECCLWK